MGKEILISDETESENCLFMWGKMKLDPYLKQHTKINWRSIIELSLKGKRIILLKKT